jgi:hypothetical protein
MKNSANAESVVNIKWARLDSNQRPRDYESRGRKNSQQNTIKNNKLFLAFDDLMFYDVL